MSEYQELRSQLISMLEELDERLDKITDDVRHSDKPLDQDFSEQAVEAENDQVLDALGNVTRDELEKIRLAIARIDAGNYGFCTTCGDAITKERLAVVPYANQCIRCAERSEHQ